MRMVLAGWDRVERLPRTWPGLRICPPRGASCPFLGDRDRPYIQLWRSWYLMYEVGGASPVSNVFLSMYNYGMGKD
jgi:hypothetical protein